MIYRHYSGELVRTYARTMEEKEFGDGTSPGAVIFTALTPRDGPASVASKTFKYSASRNISAKTRACVFKSVHLSPKTTHCVILCWYISRRRFRTCSPALMVSYLAGLSADTQLGMGSTSTWGSAPMNCAIE